MKNGRKHVSCASRNSQAPLPAAVSLGATEILRTVHVVSYLSDVGEIEWIILHARDGKNGHDFGQRVPIGE
jgi:hypothetical protein